MTKQEVRTTPITLIASEKVEIEPDVVLLAGQYQGHAKQIGVYMLGGKLEWTAPEYKLSLDAKQLKELGVDPGNLLSVEYDVTKFVKSGQLATSA
jgi:hypothetical protein